LIKDGYSKADIEVMEMEEYDFLVEAILTQKPKNDPLDRGL